MAMACRRQYAPAVSGSARDTLVLEDLDFSALADLCLAENRLRTAGDAYRFEMFRRALTQHDDCAWEWLYGQYRDLVFTWVLRQCAVQGRPLASEEEGLGLVNEAYARFSQGIRAEKFDGFPSLAALMKYLKTCVGSAVKDLLRREQRDARHYAGSPDDLQETGLEPQSPDHAEEVVSSVTIWDLWEIILLELKDRQELVAIYSVYWLEMEPKEILRDWPTLFTSLDDIYRVERNALERLRRMRWLRWYLTGERRRDFHVVGCEPSEGVESVPNEGEESSQLEVG